MIPNPWNPSNPAIFTDWRAHGKMNMREAIAYSSNVYFYYISGGYGDQKGLGILKMNEYYDLFGFGKETGVVLANEQSGTVPSPEWKVPVVPVPVPIPVSVAVPVECDDDMGDAVNTVDGGDEPPWQYGTVGQCCLVHQSTVHVFRHSSGGQPKPANANSFLCAASGSVTYSSKSISIHWLLSLPFLR